MSEFRSSVCLLSLLSLIVASGCSSESSSQADRRSAIEKKLFYFEGAPLHAMVGADKSDGTLMLITLGADAKTVQPVMAQEIKLAMKHGNHMDRFTLKAKPDPNDPAGQSSLFMAKSNHLAKAFSGKAGRSAELQLVLDGKQLVGKIEQSHDDHDHDHDHATTTP